MGSKIPLPEYETDGSAGLDLRACLDRKLETSGWKIGVDTYWFCDVFRRSESCSNGYT